VVSDELIGDADTRAVVQDELRGGASARQAFDALSDDQRRALMREHGITDRLTTVTHQEDVQKAAYDSMKAGVYDGDAVWSSLSAEQKHRFSEEYGGDESRALTALRGHLSIERKMGEAVAGGDSVDATWSRFIRAEQDRLKSDFGSEERAKKAMRLSMTSGAVEAIDGSMLVDTESDAGRAAIESGMSNLHLEIGHRLMVKGYQKAGQGPKTQADMASSIIRGTENTLVAGVETREGAEDLSRCAFGMTEKGMGIDEVHAAKIGLEIATAAGHRDALVGEMVFNARSAAHVAGNEVNTTSLRDGDGNVVGRGFMSDMNLANLTQWSTVLRNVEAEGGVDATQFGRAQSEVDDQIHAEVGAAGVRQRAVSHLRNACNQRWTATHLRDLRGTGSTTSGTP